MISIKPQVVPASFHPPLEQAGFSSARSQMGRISLTSHAAMSVCLLLMSGLENNYRDSVGGRGEEQHGVAGKDLGALVLQQTDPAP